MLRHVRWFALLAILFVTAAPLPAQFRTRPVADETGEVQLQLMLRKLRTSATLMMTTAHPDDEANGVLADAAHGLGLRTVLVTATRGDGGQNEIGPEILDSLAVLRTEELLAVHRFDGAEQLFTRAVDFGYSFSLDETYEKWGKDQIIGDYVRQIRTIRPDVILGFLWTGNNGGMHHQASTHITAEAFRAAGDPARYPEQIKEGLRPWQAKKFYYSGGGDASLPTGTYDPVLGRTYDELGSEARTMHKCQAVTTLPALPSGRGGGRGYHLEDTVIAGQKEKTETSVLDGVDIRLTGLADYAKPNVPAGLTTSLATITKDVDDAEGAFTARGLDAAIPGIAAGLHELRALRAGLASMSLSADAKFEIDFRLAQKELQFQQALVVASSLRVETIGNDPMVVPGQAVNVQAIVANRSKSPVAVTGVTAKGFAGSVSCPVQSIEPGAVYACGGGGGGGGGRGGGGRGAGGGRAGGAAAGDAGASAESGYRIPADAKPTDIYFRHDPTAGARYTFDAGVPFGAPFAPTPFRIAIGLTIGGEAVTVDQPVEARYEADKTSGEKRTELLVVPAFALTVSPEVVVAPTGGSATREVRVTVRNDTPSAANASVRLKVPSGWTVDPAMAPVTFGREDEESTVRFSVKSPANAKEGSAKIGAEVVSGDKTYATGFQVVEYPHIRKRLLMHPAEAEVRSIDLKVAPNLKVGYIMGVGDKVPDAIAQLGVPVSMIDPDEMAWGDLSKYPVIMVGVRAYERRADLRANNARLLDYARKGGTVLLNYQRTEFNQTQGGYGPYPAQTTSNRVTDENASVKILVPDHPAMTTPNKIGPATWANWVQERGTYFFAPQSPEYVDLLESQDPFPDNNKPQRGILVDAKVGQGRWVYIGLVLWRQLPAGVPGAYQLLANLISLGSH